MRSAASHDEVQTTTVRTKAETSADDACRGAAGTDPVAAAGQAARDEWAPRAAGADHRASAADPQDLSTAV